MKAVIKPRQNRLLTCQTVTGKTHTAHVRIQNGKVQKQTGFKPVKISPT